MMKMRTTAHKILLVNILLSLTLPTFAQIKKQQDPASTQQVLRYVRFYNVPIRTAPSVHADTLGFVHRYEKVYTLPDIDSMFFFVVSPLRGYVNRLMVLNEREMDEQYIRAVNTLNELHLIASKRTPYDDIINDWEGLPAFDFGRTWVNDGKYQVKFVETDSTAVKKAQALGAQTLGYFRQGQKIIIDLEHPEQSNWAHVVFPHDGFVLKHFLMLDEDVVSRLDYQQRVVKELEQTLGIYHEPEVEIEADPETKEALQYLADSVITADDIDRAYAFLDSILLEGGDTTGIIDSLLLAEIDTTDFLRAEDLPEVEAMAVARADSTIRIWWSDEIDADGNEYFEKAQLNLLVSKTDVAKKFIPRLYFRNEKGTSYQPYKLPPPSKVKNDKITTWEIGEYPDLGQDRYNFKLELLDPRSKEIIATESALNREELSLLSFEYIDSGKMGLQLSIFGVGCPYFIPVEQNFKRLSFPYGGQIELSTKKLPLSIGFGYNFQQAASSSGAFNLRNHSFFSYLKYVPVTLMQDRFEPYLFVGGTYRMSQLANVKYPEHEDYYPLELTKGFGYTGGLGGQFIIRNFIFGLQYQLFGTPLVIFGPDFDEPVTQIDLDNYIPTTQYRFFPGTNQLQLTLGYRIQ